ARGRSPNAGALDSIAHFRHAAYVPELTQLLSAIDQGEPQAAHQRCPLVYDELRKLAAHKLSLLPPGQTLQATALVHEAYLRLVGNEERRWENRRHFF